MSSISSSSSSSLISSLISCFTSTSSSSFFTSVFAFLAKKSVILLFPGFFATFSSLTSTIKSGDWFPILLTSVETR